jgi:hypothetical protein
MVHEWWDRSVRVMTGNSTAFNVERLDRAAEVLLNDWPPKRGEAYQRAMEALLKAMETPDSESARTAARMAFEEAAREAGILAEKPGRIRAAP